MQTNAAIKVHLFNLDDCYRMTESGILNDNQPVELINGELFDMSPIGSVHAGLVTRLSRLLIKSLNDEAIVNVQNPIFLNEFSSPEPDIALLKPRADDYMQSLPNADEVLLVIEISDSTLVYDKEIKLPLYAQHQIPEVWLIDAKQKQLNIYQQPSKEGYRLHLRPLTGDNIQPLLVDAINLDWQSLFIY